MPSVSLEELQAFAREAAGDRHDRYSESGLARAVEEYRAQRGEAIASVGLTLGPRTYSHIYEALRDPTATFLEGELAVIDPPEAGAAWEWSFPVSRLVFHADGGAEVHPPGGGKPIRAMVRILRRDYYVPRPASSAESTMRERQRDPRPGILPLGPALKLLREAGFVPFAVAILLYTNDERHRLELDLLESALLKDPRAGRFPMPRRVRRTSRVAHDVDAFIARGELAVRTARVLEMLVESHGLTPFEVSQVFGEVPEFGISALKALQSRGLATLDRQKGLYRPRFEAFRPSTTSRGPVEPAAPIPNPALRTSVMELLAAADARATCPLCGDPLPPGPRAILCARCEAEVAAAGPTGG